MFEKRQVPGHAFVLHFSVSSESPRVVHFFPPCCGRGLVHVLERKRCPPPHESEQSDHSVHVLYPPLTQFR